MLEHFYLAPESPAQAEQPCCSLLLPGSSRTAWSGRAEQQVLVLRLTSCGTHQCLMGSPGCNFCRISSLLTSMTFQKGPYLDTVCSCSLSLQYQDRKDYKQPPCPICRNDTTSSRRFYCSSNLQIFSSYPAHTTDVLWNMYFSKSL